jgi:parallel beta-helix repeat protein
MRRFWLTAAVCSALVAAALTILRAEAGGTQTFVVDTTSDANLTACTGAANDCSFRGALNRANGSIAPDVINFAVGSGQVTININSTGLGALPAITDRVEINGQTQPGYNAGAPAPVVELRGTALVGAVPLLQLSAGVEDDGTIIRALALTDGPGNGITISAGTVHLIIGNYIGVAFDGTTDLGNDGDGIRIDTDAEDVTIGGYKPAERNLISGNGVNGIRAVNTTGLNIYGNYIGTNAAGGASIQNIDGVNILNSLGTEVGGTTAGQGNLISGNADDGVEISGTSTGTLVRANLIGTNAAGDAALANGANGIQQTLDTSGSIIGGNTAASRNVISGNAGTAGILMQGDTNTIESNYIGLNAAGTAAIPNNIGISLSSNATSNSIGDTGLGNVISGNLGAGAVISGSGNFVIGNIVGLNAAGTVSMGNGGSGVHVTGTNNLIGGDTAGERNVISRNILHGVEITGDAGDGNDILGNYIGLGANGTTDLGNLLDGVHIDAGDNNLIGGFSASDRNVISGNNSDGIELSNDANGNSIHGNYIGPAVDGITDRGNSLIGVNVISSDSNTIGDGGNGNVISGNNQDGVEITSASLSNIVQDNLLGVGADFVSALGNGTNGIQIAGSSSNTTVGGSGFQRNHIAFNGGDGVTISSGTGNILDQNSIHDNGALGVDLANDNIVTPNDPAPDADAGANNLQNFPVLTSASSVTTSTSIGLTLESVPSTQFTIRFYHSASCDPSTHGEGETPFSTTVNVNTNAAGTTPTVSAIMPDATPSLRFITATATDPNGNTSEFSNCVQVPALIVDTTSDSGAMTNCTVAFTDCSLRGAIANANASPDKDVISFSIGGGGAQTISPTAALPSITTPVTIDGTTQGGFAGTPIIQINGTNAGATTDGLTITGANTTIRGLVVNRFAGGDGIAITGDGNTIVGNYIGTNTGGTAALPNNFGITVLNSLNNTIGGLLVADRNLVSGNLLGGVDITGSTSTGNHVFGNYIGTDAAGTGAVGNNDGVRIVSAPGNTIGGFNAARNIISGNGRDGVRILSAGADNNIVLGNYIGTNAAGTAAVPNGGGVLIDGDNNTIGGTTPPARNLISGNSNEGVEIRSGGNGNTISGNYIGTNLAGTAALANVEGGVLIDNTANNTVGGTTAGARNVISGNGTHGVMINAAGATGNLVQGNYVGTNSSGTAALGNNLTGIHIEGASGNTIGGSVAGAGNVASGNVTGICACAGATANQILGNLVGTDASGTLAVANTGTGVVAVAAANGNTIGGGSAVDRNVISGNTDSGLSIVGSSGNFVYGNYIGTDASGTADLGNGLRGVSVSNGSNNHIGAAFTGAGNLISGNDLDGVSISGGGATGNEVVGNVIGTDVTGTIDRGNSAGGIELSGASDTTIGGKAQEARNLISGNNGHGIEMFEGADNSVFGNDIGLTALGQALGNSGAGIRVVDSASNTIGGRSAGDGNWISHNALDGIEVSGGLALGNEIAGNSLSANGGLGIDILPNGVTPNDAGDTDGGANSTQNFPVITSVVYSFGPRPVNGTLNSTANTTFTLDFYYENTCDASGNGEGGEYAGSSQVTTNASGNATFGVVLPIDDSGPSVSVTATSPTGATSEFSACVLATDDGDDDNDGFTDDVEAGTPLCANSANDDGAPVNDDVLANDGCPAIGPAEGGADCADTVDDDADTRVNDGCPQLGAFSEAQFNVGTASQDPCGSTAWPSDLFSGGASANKLTIQDVTAFILPGPSRHLDTSPGHPNFSSRFDIVPGRGALGQWINIQDILALVNGVSGNPPMFGNTRAFDKVCPWAP